MVETAIESDLILFARLFDDGKDFLNFLNVVVNGLFAENVLACAESLNRQRRMLVSRRANQYGFNFGVAKNFFVIFGCLLDADRFCPSFGLFVHERVGNRLDCGVFDEFGNAFAVHVSDTSCTDDTYFNH